MAKKILFILVLSTFSLSAQFTDDMESYTEGEPISEDWWTDWNCGGGAGCAIMSSSDFARSGNKSGFMPDDGTSDAVLDLGNKIFGDWGLIFYMYVPSNREAYMNLQGIVPVGGGEWIVGNIHFNRDLLTPGQGIIDDSAIGAVEFSFPHDNWFCIRMNINISSGISLATWQFDINGTDVIPAGTPFTDSAGNIPTSLGGLNFFSISNDSEFYVDDFWFSEGEPDFSPCTVVLEDQPNQLKKFTIFPNPINDVLVVDAIEPITNISIYNSLGQLVYKNEANATSLSIDTSNYPKGIYFVHVTIGNQESVVKIIK